jgi:hypothetical protein
MQYAMSSDLVVVLREIQLLKDDSGIPLARRICEAKLVFVPNIFQSVSQNVTFAI